MKDRPSTLTFVLVLSTLIVSILTSCSGGEPQVAASNNTGGEEAITAFVNVNLVPMTEERIVENQTVLVEGTRITAIGPTDEVAIPEPIPQAVSANTGSK